MGLFAELRRRNVIRVAMAYLVLSWLLLQVGDVVFGLFGLPDWSLRLLAAMLALGLLPTLVFAWAYELTPDGLKRDADVARAASVADRTGRKLNVITAVLLAAAIVLFVTEDRWRPAPGGSALSAEEAPDSKVAADDAPAAATGEGPPSDLSIAVMPFANMSADAANEYFADGISEEILNLLADVEALSVASRTSAFAFKGRGTPIPEIANALRVRYVLEGSVRKAGNQVRITAQLIDASSDRHLWSETFDRQLDDIFAIQDEIAGAIGAALQVELLGKGGQAVEAETVDPEIYAQFLEARHLLRLRTPESVRAGNELLIRIVERAPDFARAHAVLAEAYILNRTLVGDMLPLVPHEVAGAQARIHAEIARSLDPTLGGVDLILGVLARDEADMVAALGHYDRAVELEPNEPRPYHWRGMLLANAGYLDDALADLARARELDPENPNTHIAYVATLVTVGEHEAYLREAAAHGEILRAARYMFLTSLHLDRGDRTEALVAAERVLTFDLQEVDRPFWSGVVRSLRTGDPLLSEELPQSYRQEWRYFVSSEERLAWLDGVDFYPHPSYSAYWSDTAREIRRDPRFIAFLDRHGVLDVWRERGIPPDCRPDGETFSCGHGD